MTTKSIYNYNTVLAYIVHLVRFCSDLIDEILEKSKSNQGKRNDLTSGSAEPEVEKETNVKLAELAKTSKASVQRMKKVKKESPELYR